MHVFVLQQCKLFNRKKNTHTHTHIHTEEKKNMITGEKLPINLTM